MPDISPRRSIPLLGAQDWATLSMTILAAVGRGYARTYSKENEEFLSIIRNTSLDKSEDRRDPPPSIPCSTGSQPTAEHLHTYLAPDHEGARDWIQLTYKTKTCFSLPSTMPIRQCRMHWRSGKVFQIKERSIKVGKKSSGVPSLNLQQEYV